MFALLHFVDEEVPQVPGLGFGAVHPHLRQLVFRELDLLGLFLLGLEWLGRLAGPSQVAQPVEGHTL